ncbi:hypothetical protein L4X54_20715, partial [Phocaeicola vulgatus]|nr:hypothetical protein [Phocaeicola vulgatus]MCG0274293.1 hypothetical protein [Phocaeicola vulgatus]
MREHFRKEEKYNKNNYRGFSMESAVFFAIWYFIDLHHLPFTIKCLPLQRINRLSRFLAGIIFYTREVLLTSHYEKRLFEHASQPRVACADIRL